MPKSEIHPKWYPEAKVICNGADHPHAAQNPVLLNN